MVLPVVVVIAEPIEFIHPLSVGGIQQSRIL
jgi:hypothetical protein